MDDASYRIINLRDRVEKLEGEYSKVRAEIERLQRALALESILLAEMLPSVFFRILSKGDSGEIYRACEELRVAVSRGDDPVSAMEKCWHVLDAILRAAGQGE